MKKLTLLEFINRSLLVHGDNYDYSKANYINSQTKIIILCPEHGAFEQLANDHLSGHGCNKCRAFNINKIRSQKCLEDFESKSNIIHSNKYDYSKVSYIGARQKVEIICPIHGSFWQKPNTHLSGCGCPKCKTDASGWSKTSWKNAQKGRVSKLYVIKFKNKNTNFIKVGITHLEVEKRLEKILYAIPDKTFTGEILKTISSINSETIFNLERKILKDLKIYKYKFDKKFDGSTECFLNRKEVINYLKQL